MKFRGNTFDSVWGISSINISALHHDNKHTLITNYTPRTITKCTCNKNKKITCSHNSNLATAITDNKMSVDSWHVPVVCLGHRVLVKTDRPSTTVFTDPLGIGPLHRIICNPYSTWGGGDMEIKYSNLKSLFLDTGPLSITSVPHVATAATDILYC
jgi:hypothetical protein